MNQNEIWALAREKAVEDRLEFATCVGEGQMFESAQSEIKRFKAMKGYTYSQARAADGEGVRLALLAAECYYQGLKDAQIGKEKRSAAAMFKRVNSLRVKHFGLTKLEVMVSKATRVPVAALFTTNEI
jgi:hypothetical protein